MDKYTNNSHKHRREEEKKRVEKIISGSANIKKRSEVRKFADVFLPSDMSKVKDSIFLDIIMPSLKKVLLDGFRTLLYGNNTSDSNSGIPASRVQYTNYSNRTNYTNPNRTPVRSAYNYDDIELDNRGDAELVIMQLEDTISEYGFAKVSDLYDLVGITCNYTDYDYGWDDLRRAYIDPVGSKFRIRLPRAKPID